MLTNVGTLKEALHEDLRRSETPPKVLCEEMGMALSTLYNCCNPEVTDCHMKLKDLVYFSKRTGGCHTIAFLNLRHGMVTIPIKDLGNSMDRLESLMAANVSMFGEVLGDYAQAISDKQVTIEEARRLEADIDMMLQKLATLRESINSAALNGSVTP